MTAPQQIVLGIDGGGSTSLAWLAPADPSGAGVPLASGQRRSETSPSDISEPLGRGVAGPSNPQSVGWEQALANLDVAVDTAFADAGLARTRVRSACVALAGGDRDEARRRLHGWAEAAQLADTFLPTHDAAALLAAGTPGGAGIALVSGTGSFAFGQTTDGRTARAGGWGYLFGDEGSGYAIGVAGLRAVAAVGDGRGPATALSDRLFERLGISSAEELIPVVYPHAADRQWVAALAELVLAESQAGDVVSTQIVEQAGVDLAAIVEAVAKQLKWPTRDVPIALGGSLLLRSPVLSDALLQRLFAASHSDANVRHVSEPVAGAVILAREL